MSPVKTNKFGGKIKILRLNKKLPLRIVSEYLGIDQAILSKIERGLRRATREQVIRLAEYHKITEDELLVAWLSDKLLNEVGDEELALNALQIAEESIRYAAEKKMNLRDIKKELKNYFIRDKRISKAWIFGSFAREDTDHESDIDILIEVPEKQSFTLFDIAEIKYQLEQIIPVKVDVVMRHAVKPEIFKRILPDLKLIYER